jgi:hypothetical protein
VIRKQKDITTKAQRHEGRKKKARVETREPQREERKSNPNPKRKRGRSVIEGSSSLTLRVEKGDKNESRK